MALLALVAGQDVEPADGSDGTDGRWRIARRVAEDRVISTVDPQARHVHKTVHHRQDGYKGHVAVEPDTGLFTAGELTQACGRGQPRSRRRAGPADARHRAGPFEVLGDSAYGTGDARAALDRGRAHRDHQTGAAAPGRRGRVHPRRLHRRRGRPAPSPARTGITRPITASRSVTFGAACRGCPLRRTLHHRQDRPHA